MNKQELIAAVAEDTQLARAKVAEVMESVFRTIEGALRQEQDVRLVGFGTFVIASRKAGKGRNPRTGEAIDIPRSHSVRFKPGKTLKAAVS